MNILKVKLLISYVILSCISCSSGISLKISNKGDYPIYKLKVIYTGGTIFVERIATQEDKRFIIKPKSESDIKLEYMDSESNKFKCKIDVYLEKGYSGSMDIKIKKSGKLNYKYIEKHLIGGDIIEQAETQCAKIEY